MNILYGLTLLCTVHASFSTSPRKNLDFQDLAKYDGYNSEEHFVTTEDGYILRLFRIPKKESCTASNGSMIFMHGLYLSSDDCLVPGPGTAHCYLYHDNCYDVWVPNVRGNYYSRNHTTYDPDTDSSFWDFSIDEMAMYDLPAVIDYVLLKTNETQLAYVAHSQGVALLLILCSKKPEYNAKIKVGFGLSPTAWLYNSKFIVIMIQSQLAPLLTLTGPLLNKEILTRNGIARNFVGSLCGSSVTYTFCSASYFAILGYDKYQITSEGLPVVTGHVPSGTSLKNFIRWGQITNNGFTEYDYGTVTNRLKYGQTTSKKYDVSRVTMKWIFIGSDNDYIANVTDIQTLASNLPNSSLCVLSDTTFGHLDFIYGKDIPNYITPVIFSALATGNYKCP